MHKLFPLLVAAACPCNYWRDGEDLPGLVASRDKVMGINSKEIWRKRIVRPKRHKP